MLMVAFLLAALAVFWAIPSGAVNDVTIDGTFADWADELCKPDDTCDDFNGQRDAKAPARQATSSLRDRPPLRICGSISMSPG